MTYKWYAVLCPLILAASLQSATVRFDGPGGGVINDYDVFSNTPGVTTFQLSISGQTRPIDAAGNNTSLYLTGIDHPFLGDLEATLTYVETGMTATVFYRVGAVTPGDAGSLANLAGNYAFNSAAPNSLWVVAVPLGDADFVPEGFYQTTNAFSPAPNTFSSAFNGITPNGRWLLTIRDYSADPNDEFRFLTNWALEFNLADNGGSVPEPVSLSLAAFGLLAITATRFLSAGR